MNKMTGLSLVDICIGVGHAKKLTITMDEVVYEGLVRLVPSGITQDELGGVFNIERIMNRPPE